ncbi:SGNH/GDSL hydrolase family protein [Flavobacterium algicola]|uniref:SGNH/GDSL hydrolase family protein n=1 Tax=Flavobacterium algicola TaxID=556529 RepID=UPI001EFE78BA|nr:SGNH/GDSL hydrolase family protein [Flavobacterium algicola]MCG9792855.1 SGNH/GDSL hydrolase family protein [Flavobacterium algicola]
MKCFIRKLLLLIFFLAVAKVNAQVLNSGVSGNATTNLLGRLETDVIQQKPDLVVMMIGTNDMLNSKKMLTYKEYENNLVKIIQRIKDTGAKVVLMSSPPVDSIYLFERHDRKLFKETPNVKMDSVRKIQQRLAQKMQLHSINLYQKFVDMNLPKHDEDLFFKSIINSKARDGVHLTSLGYHFIGQTVFQYLNVNKLLSKDQKIICFGDSITFGAGVKTGGSVNGESYPAILNKLKNELFSPKE